MVIAVILTIWITGGVIGSILMISGTYRELRKEYMDNLEKVLALSVVGILGFMVWPLVIIAVSLALYRMLQI